MSTPRRAALAMMALAVVSASLLSAAPASASSDQTLVSLDGLSFSQAPAGSLFSPSFRAVPGDVLTGTLWVQNPTDINTRLTLAITDASGGSDLLGAMRMVYTPNEWLPVDDQTGQCGQMTLSRVVSPGATTRVDLKLVVDSALSQSVAQGETARFAVRATLTDAAAPVAPNACTAIASVSGLGEVARISNTQLPSMAQTGVAPLLSVSLAGGAILVGVALAAIKRRSREETR